MAQIILDPGPVLQSHTRDRIPMTLAAGTRLGRYEIRSKIGVGGMGEVYLAQDTKLDRKVALKILPAEVAAHPHRMKRFVQEAKTASTQLTCNKELARVPSVSLIPSAVHVWSLLTIELTRRRESKHPFRRKDSREVSDG